MIHIFPRNNRLGRPRTSLDTYFANLQQQASIGLPTFDEAKRDYQSAGIGEKTYLIYVPV